MNRKQRRAIEKQLHISVFRRPADGLPLPALEDWLDELVKSTEDQYHGTSPLEITAIGVRADGEMIVFSMPTTDDTEKKQSFAVFVSKAFAAASVVRWADMCEGWISESRTTRPSLSDDRKEIIQIAVSDGEHSAVAILEIERDWETAEPTLKRLSDTKLIATRIGTAIANEVGEAPDDPA